MEIDSQTKTPQYHHSTFIVTENTPIGFGKLRDLPHKEFFKISHRKYVQWILKTDDDFRYKATKTWLQAEIDKLKFIQE